jgi:hypothetical protein
MSDRSWESIGSEFGKVLKKTKYQKKIKKMKKTSIMAALVIGILLISLLGIRSLYRGATGADAKEAKAELIEDCGCGNIEDCLAKDKIDCAWKMYNEKAENNMDTHDDLMKLVKAEGTQHIINKTYDEGWLRIGQNDLGYDQHLLWAYKYEYLNSVIDQFIAEDNLKGAKLWAMKASDEHNTSGWQKEQTDDFDRRKTQRKLLLKKVKEFR